MATIRHSPTTTALLLAFHAAAHQPPLTPEQIGRAASSPEGKRLYAELLREPDQTLLTEGANTSTSDHSAPSVAHSYGTPKGEGRELSRNQREERREGNEQTTARNRSRRGGRGSHGGSAPGHVTDDGTDRAEQG